MNLFDKLTTEALSNQPDYAALRIVVEKELLHHDILNILSQNGLLKDLTFIGGTALRSCYGGVRLSEDLDFTGGADFSRHQLSEIGAVLTHHLFDKYALPIEVSEPQKETSNVETWKIKMTTRPEQKSIPKQQINIDICAIPSYQKQPMMLLNPYGVNMGTGGLIIQTQSQEEVYTDKLLAFALRPNRLKYRDIWDMVWLNQHHIKPDFSLISKKLRDRKIETPFFTEAFRTRHQLLLQNPKMMLEFKKEMQRFLPLHIYTNLEQNHYWDFVTYLIGGFQNKIDEIL